MLSRSSASNEAAVESLAGGFEACTGAGGAGAGAGARTVILDAPDLGGEGVSARSVINASSSFRLTTDALGFFAGATLLGRPRSSNNCSKSLMLLSPIFLVSKRLNILHSPLLT
jgi:hypothetical protein